MDVKPEGTACKISTRQITCCREPCLRCNGLCEYRSEVPYDTHFESPRTIHFCKGCFRAKRESKDKSHSSHNDDYQEEQWDDSSWSQSWGWNWQRR